MLTQALIGMVNNAALLLLLAWFYDALQRNRFLRGTVGRGLCGLMLGGICICIMLNAWSFDEGTFFDTRSVMLALAGLFFGPFPAIIGGAIAAGYRIYVGGAGTGMGLALIVSSVTIGLVWRQLRWGNLADISHLELFGFGMTVHLAMLAATLCLPREMAGDVFRAIVLPVMTILPVVTILSGAMLSWSLKRIRTDEALRDSEERNRFLAGVVENSTQPFAIAYPDGHVGRVNNAFCKLLGYERREIEGVCLVNDLTPPEWRKREAHMIGQLDQTGLAIRYEKEYCRKDGSRVPVELLVHRVLRDEDTTDYYYAFITNLTERKRSEQALIESERRYRELFQNAPAGIFQTTSDGHVIRVNQRMAEILGCDSVKECLRHYRELAEKLYSKPKDREDFLRHLQCDGEVQAFELEALRIDGESVWLSVSAKLREWRNDGNFLIEGFVTDITQRRREQQARLYLEEQLRQSQKMEAIGQLAGGVAHDFNNILQASLGYAKLASMRVKADDALKGYIDQIVHGSLSAANLTRQLLAFSRRQVMRPAALDLNKVIEDLLRMLYRVIGEHIHIEFIPAHELASIKADRGMMEQIVMNLCVNARDAMSDGGALTLETENLVIDGDYCATHPWASPGRYVLLSVSDTGCGIEAEVLKHIFEPFFTTKGEGKGTGLGLATVYGVIKQHDGMVQAYSEPGKGSTFKVYLPVSERRAEVVGPKIEGPVAGGDETILMAEDNDSVCDLAQQVLELGGYTVILARNGEEAVALFEAHCDAIDMLLFDVVMPQMGGREAYERIQAIRPEVPVLFSSGYSENAVHTNFVLHEGVKLLQKPYSPNTLLRAVRETLDENAGSSPHCA